MSQQETATDRLVSVIQAIQLSQGNGALTVWRGEGGTLEEGVVIFVNGQVTQTMAGRRSGKAALNWLSTWGKCRYTFVPNSAAITRRQPQSQPVTPAPVVNPENEPARTTDTYPRIPISPLRRRSEPLELPGEPGRASPPFVPPGRDERVTSIPATTVPFPTRPLEEATRSIGLNGLSRSHRQLFLLVDGQRSLLDVSRLVGKNQGEVSTLLRDLERIGVIRLGGV